MTAAAQARLAAALPPGATLRALDAGRFVLWLPSARRDTALALALRLAHGAATALDIDGIDVHAGLRVGLALGEPGEEDAAAVARAEQALRAALRRGLDVLAHDRLATSADGAAAAALLTPLRLALDDGGLDLMLQPRIALADGGIVGAQASLRWRHPQRSALVPADFFPAAAPTGLARRLSAYTVEACARRWEYLRSSGASVRLSVGLTPPDPLDDQLPARLGEALRRHRVPPQAFCLQVPASVYGGEAPQAELALRLLAELGFRLAVAGLGRAAVSPAALARLPLHEACVDADLSAQGRAVALASTRLADALGLAVVATGVRTLDDAQTLHGWGCPEAQGPAYADPLAADGLPDWCAGWRERPPPESA